MLSAFRRERLAEAAQNLAARGMRGEAAEPAFMEIIRYFPEDSVQDDLAFGWGAAFVYHCALKAGLEFPVRFRLASRFRFSRVEAWLTVAQGPFGRQNLAGLTEWSRSDLDVCYLRIPDGCQYDGWKYDYKTQQLRMQVF